MKALSFLFVLILGFTLSVIHAQKVKTYRVWITLADKEQVKGTLYAAQEDELVILGEDLTRLSFRPTDLHEIKLRSKGKIGQGAWIGALSGALAGGIIGYAGGDDEPGWFSSTAEEKAAGGAIFGVSVGALIGVGVGTGKEKMVINEDRGLYIATLPRLQQYALQKDPGLELD